MSKKKEYPLFGKYLEDYKGEELMKMAIYLYKKAEAAEARENKLIEEDLNRLMSK